jgi:phospholipid/cholesterol/gamma-HCH transport system substrate-binding protein
MSSASKVGFFVFLGLALLFGLATQVGSFKNMSKEGYHVYSNMGNVAGLDKNSKIKANGIDVGYIEDLKIEGDHVKIKMFFYDGVKVPANSTIRPLQESMLGGKYVALTLGTDTKPVDDGGFIKSSAPMADFNDASNAMTETAVEIQAFTKELRTVLTSETRESLRMTFSNLEKITDELRKFTQQNILNDTAKNFNEMAIKLAETGDGFTKVANTINYKLPEILQNLDKLVRDLKYTSAEIRMRVPELAAKFERVEDDLQVLLKENKEPVNNAIKAADSFFSSGTETFDKVDDLLQMIDRVKLEVAMRQEYMVSDDGTKGYVSLNYKPSDTKTYEFEIASVDDYTNSDENGNIILPKTHDESEVLFSAQVAKRYDDLVLRAGIIENTAGAGVDYFMLDDKFKASAQIHDFNAQYDIRGENPHAKVAARYTLLKHVDFYGGYDNFLNDEADNAYVGLGFRFFDDDLKTLIMSQSLGSMAK